MILAVFTTSNKHYQFPTIDFTTSAVDILTALGHNLHSTPFNSSLLKLALYDAATVKNAPLISGLCEPNLHFTSLKNFKDWMIKHDPTRSQHNNQHMLRHHIQLFHTTSQAHNLRDVQSQLIHLSQLHHLTTIPVESLYSIIRITHWSKLSLALASPILFFFFL
ncbi:uncharacterized protein RJT21DRAFT_30873 [Scheffersomyces amazonensis]|uniref:uncharacterized protein n=1 Tax=Scheffersomyces amazonensis TaxID=1078765 RepID=UPI00315D79B5